MEHHATLVLRNRSIARDYHELLFAWPDGLPPPRPGQFLTIRVVEAAMPLLRRPFAVSSFDARSRTAGIIYQRRGPATTLLAAADAGDMLDMLVPLGNWFPEPEPEMKVVLAAGGIGMGPIFYFARELRLAGGEPLLVLGARGVAHLPAEDLLDGLDANVCTDDGSRGFPGTVLDYIEHSGIGKGERCVIYGCGPTPMLAAVAAFARERQLPFWVSMEQTMGCAVGACMGCAIPVHGPARYARVCTEGPVFDAREIVWTSH
ncbi:dihydroorotate dehydrogenase electron transfer subunit [Salinispira pacifica]